MRTSGRLVAILAVSVAGAVVGCGVGDDSCRGSADCSGSEECSTPSDVPVCGIGCSVDRACEDASTCGAGMACAEYVGTCCAPWEALSSRCVPACTVTSCQDGERCAASGACEPVPCADGYTCSRQLRCTTPGRGADRHGCQRIPCSSDGDCQSPGYCVSGQCRDSLGVCEVPMLVP